MEEQESDFQPSVIGEAKELGIKHQDEEKSQKNESKRRKMSMKTASGYKGKEKFKCNSFNVNFVQIGTLKKQVETVHEGKKPFKCNISDASFGIKGNLRQHLTNVHEV